MVRYLEVLQMQERGLKPGRKEFLLARYLPDRDIILEHLAVVVDKFGLIVLWYLPGAIDEVIQVGLQVSLMIATNCSRMICWWRP